MSLRFVLVATRHPGNIGATARAMKTMGLSELVLVAPETFPHADATARASGADDVLAKARVVATLAEAVADCGLVYGTSAHVRSRYYWPGLTPREAAPRLQAAAREGHAAVVFGTERIGLTNEELEGCHALIHIPTDPEFDSLNLAQAVQVIAYELRLALDLPPLRPARDVPLAPVAELEQLWAHFDAVLREVDFTDRNGGPHLLRRVKRILSRAELDQHEVNILRGILSAVQAKRRRAGSTP
ncbi:MAG: RNA methyltransferase [Steroidobacteraceae bacterium]|nr:RNA methyltransferase [Steroidobacteraceae bacterium]